MNEDEVRQHIEDGVQQVFAAAAHLNGPELVMVRAIWESEDPVRRDAVWAKAKAHVQRMHRAQFLKNASDQITEWTNASWIGSRTGAVVLGGGLGNSGFARRQAMEPLLDAALAVIAADGLDEDERSFLLNPVRSVAREHGINV